MFKPLLLHVKLSGVLNNAAWEEKAVSFLFPQQQFFGGYKMINVELLAEIAQELKAKKNYCERFKELKVPFPFKIYNNLQDTEGYISIPNHIIKESVDFIIEKMTEYVENLEKEISTADVFEIAKKVKNNEVIK